MWVFFKVGGLFICFKIVIQFLRTVMSSLIWFCICVLVVVKEKSRVHGIVFFYLKKIVFSIRNEWVIWWMSFIVRPWHMGGGWRQYTIFYYWIKEKRYYKTKTFDIYTLYDKSQASVKRFRSRFFAFPLTTQNSNQKNFFFSRLEMNCHELCGNWLLTTSCIGVNLISEGLKKLWFMRKNLGIYYGYYGWLWVLNFWI